jgi:hypothetical protein
MDGARMLTDRAVIPRRARGYEAGDDGRLLVEYYGLTHRMLPGADGGYHDENDPSVGLRVHDTDGAITIDYPFTWFTGYRDVTPGA